MTGQPLIVVQKSYTAWVSDLGSQIDYGIKEKVVAAGAVTLAQAESIRDQVLAAHGRPQPSFLQSKFKNLNSKITLTCRGWWTTLGWTYYANPAGLESYPTEGIGTQAVGDIAADTQFAQSWQAATSGWDLDSVWIKASKAGAPADDLVVSLYADVAGSPGGAALASGSLAGSFIDLNYSWVKFALSPVVTVGAGVYWFVVSRSGGLDAVNFYKLKVNEACGYSRGAAKVWNGSAWGARTPDADLNFTALGTQETTSQLADIAASASGQFLAGIKIEDASDLYSSPYRGGVKTGLQEIKDILASGNSSAEGLVASVDAARVLHVRRKPAGSQLTQGSDGIVRDAYGQVVPEDEIVAQWVKIERPGLELSEAQFITRVEMRGDGKMTLEW